MPITNPGIYTDVPMAEYIRDPAPKPSLNAGVAHLLLTRSAWHAWYAHPRLNPNWTNGTTDAAELGTVAHALLIDNTRDGVAVVNAKDWRTKDAKAQRAAARATGKTPILASTMATVEAMVESARAHLGRAEFDWATLTERERTVVWSDNGQWLRSRPDWLSFDSAVMVDYKTTGAVAEPDAWARGPMYHMGYDLQAALAIRGLMALKPEIKEPVFVFAVQETEPPYAMSLVTLSPAYLDFAKRRLGNAINAFRYCLENDRWPSYTGRLAYVDPPGWATMAWEIEHADDDGRPIAEQLGA